ncbi:MAG: response regulator [Rhodomicrobium sp.]|nr:response regulator [Rhodomicrobium sp.]
MSKPFREDKKRQTILSENFTKFSSGSAIAIIDDMESNRVFLEFLSRRLPKVRRVKTYASPLAALAAFADDGAPDLIITNFNTPEMNAIAFLEAIRRLPDFEDVPVIVVSSLNETDSRRRALEAGATDFLMVPFDTFEFQTRTRNLLRLSLHQKRLKSQSRSLRSELQVTQDQSKRTENRFTSIIDSVPALVFAVNAAGECVFANQFCFDFLGSSAGSRHRDAQHLAAKLLLPEERADWDRRLEPQEIVLAGADGEDHVFLLVPKRIDDAEEEQDLVVYSGIEISQLKATERSLRKAKDEAESANRAKSAFLSNMTHEIRTPLNAIIGFTDIICSELYGPVGNEKYKSYLEDVSASAKHLLAIINDILDFSQIEARRTTVNLSRFSLRDCLEEIRNLTRQQVKARGNRLQLRDIPDLIVNSDRQKLSQVFLNILTNANKATRNGLIRIEAERRDDGALIVTVADNGVGMDEREVALAVSEFGRVSTSAFVSDGHAGTGLGLPISIGFMTLLGGHLELDSAKDAGTQVRIGLPGHAIAGDRAAAGRADEEGCERLGA